jgi:H+-transporting ATPase
MMIFFLVRELNVTNRWSFLKVYNYSHHYLLYSQYMDDIHQKSGFTGLDSATVEKLRKQYGPNALPEKKKNIFKKLLIQFVSPVSLMLLAAAILSLVNGSTVDFWIILVLFFSNFLISAWHEGKADSSIKKLQEHLTFKIKTLRDGAWILVNSVELVPGDVVALKIGTVVPADLQILDASNLNINESVLTGESLPKIKNIGDTAYSGSFIATGEGVGRVTAIGGHTNFGTMVGSIDTAPKKSALEKDILAISKFISIISIIVVVILTVALVIQHSHITDIATLDLSLLIAGIPVALPTVMSLIISIGVVGLAKKNAIVRRLASLEDLANVNLLLSDKTGTLTENKIIVEQVIPSGSYTIQDVVAYGASALTDAENNPFEQAVAQKASELGVHPYAQIKVIPGDSERKRSTATISVHNAERVISIGAEQVIESLCSFTEAEKQAFQKTVDDAAAKGYRTHAVAVSRSGTEEKNMELVGVMLLADKLREDARETIAFMNENGITVKMVTGDNYEISERACGALGIPGVIYRRSVLDNNDTWLTQNFNSIAGFSEVVPKDKYNLVMFARAHYVVAATGDGVNDLLALKAADVGFAVSNAVDALKSTADIVLISPGIAVIKDAIIEARKIFVRLYNYSVYRISESFRLIITIAVIGLAYGTYPLTPVEIIILAFLNDLPIVSLAFDRVRNTDQPAHINVRERFSLSIVFGCAGVANSLILLYIMIHFMHLPWGIIQTMFFLKLTVSGHMLVYVAHTKERWYKFLPSSPVIIATTLTQLAATTLCLLGLFTAKISFGMVVIVWGWSFLWMQISEVLKIFQQHFFKKKVVVS